MKTGIKCLFAAVMVLIYCLPIKASAEPHHRGQGHGGHHGHVDHHHGHVGYHSDYGYQCGMSDSAFNYFESMVKDAFFESKRMELVREAAASNSFTVAQVIRIMNIMDFESYKIEAAAIMYHSVCDMGNWYMVYGALTYSSSSDELRAKIQ